MTTASARPATPAASGGYRGDLILFMTIAFGVSWASWAVAIGLGGPSVTPLAGQFHLFGAFGPLIGALVIRVRRGRRGRPAPEHSVRFRPADLAWAPLLLVAASAIVLAAAFISHAAGGPAPSLDGALDVIAGFGGPATFLVGLIIGGPLAEEPGWRGTAYPRMRATQGRFLASLILGALWAVWHLPLFFIGGTVQNSLGATTPSGVIFAASSIPMAMLCCYAYERGGVLTSIAVHVATNATMVLLDVQQPVTLALIMGIQAVAAAALLATTRPANRPTAATTSPLDSARTH
ncbi:CPBP family intramembrane glutamic endopeptidase [Nonomuraea mesophila]|nr:type II CAAX endopeptidase family protein [Nonomuraea mesophila]